MMANRCRGEIEAVLDGRRWTLCLTLGALAELESAFGVQDLSGLFEKLSSGSISAAQLNAILGAGLRGGGHDVGDEEVRFMRSEDGVAGLAKIVAELMTASFGTGQEGTARSNPKVPQHG